MCAIHEHNNLAIAQSGIYFAVIDDIDLLLDQCRSNILRKGIKRCEEIIARCRTAAWAGMSRTPMCCIPLLNWMIMREQVTVLIQESVWVKLVRLRVYLRIMLYFPYIY